VGGCWYLFSRRRKKKMKKNRGGSVGDNLFIFVDYNISSAILLVIMMYKIDRIVNEFFLFFIPSNIL